MTTSRRRALNYFRESSIGSTSYSRWSFSEQTEESSSHMIEWLWCYAITGGGRLDCSGIPAMTETACSAWSGNSHEYVSSARGIIFSFCRPDSGSPDLLTYFKYMSRDCPYCRFPSWSVTVLLPASSPCGGSIGFSVVDSSVVNFTVVDSTVVDFTLLDFGLLDRAFLDATLPDFTLSGFTLSGLIFVDFTSIDFRSMPSGADISSTHRVAYVDCICAVISVNECGCLLYVSVARTRRED